MWHPYRSPAWAIAVLGVALVGFACGAPISPNEWRYSSPILQSQIRALLPGEADRILSRFCETPVGADERRGQSCTTAPLGAAFSDIVDHCFYPKGVFFGHFLGPESDDAAVSGSSAESHPFRWGGTLLLTKRGGAWTPVLYRSAMIIDVCEKVALPNGREILLCEDEDSGMGHALHDLYVVDLQHPADLRHSLLARADSFQDECLEQKQILRGLQWRADRRLFSVELETEEWSRRSTEPYCRGYPKRRPASLRLKFAVGPDGLHKVEPKPAGESEPAGR